MKLAFLMECNPSAIQTMMFNSTKFKVSIDRELYELRAGHNTNTAFFQGKSQPGNFGNDPVFLLASFQ